MSTDKRDTDHIENVGKEINGGYAEHHEDLDMVKVTEGDIPDCLVEEVSYGPGGIKGIISSPYVVGAAFLASLGGFSFGYDQGVISVINVMPQFHKQFPETNPDNSGSGFYTGFMTAMLELGAFLGCFFMPKLADKISRKWALTVVVIIFNIGAIIQTCAFSYGQLVAGRTIGGIGVGTLALLRGALLVLESISIVSGVVIAYWITYGTRYIDSEVSFRLPFGLQILSAALLGTCIHFFPYSPRWLCLAGRDDDALKSLSKLRRLPPTDERVQTEWRGIMAEVEFQRVVLENVHPGKSGLKLELLTWFDLFRKKNIRRTIVGCGVAFFQQFSGINAFIYYAPILFQSIGNSYDTSLILSGVLNIMQLVAVILCFFVIDRVGRRPLAIWGGFASTVPYIIIAILVSLYSSDWLSHKPAGWACVAMAFLYILTYGISYAPLGWCLPSEVFSNATRAKGVALSTSTVWLCNFIIGVAVPPMLESAGFGTYVFFACWCFLAGVWAFFLVPETKGRSLEEMDLVFGDATGVREMEIMRVAVEEVRVRVRGMDGGKGEVGDGDV
ncbi:MAG: hypothetical protein M1834_001195 [Cirrosporium novae-zelandiae]|nr:MAG: hypothetical protein M1834_001195 [Cirrosporium novae-zelandiae]